MPWQGVSRVGLALQKNFRITLHNDRYKKIRLGISRILCGRGKLKGSLYLVATLLATTVAGAGMAQTVPAEPSAPAAEGQEGPSDTEILVTAQRRSERLTDVPISIAAISADILSTQQIQTTLDIPKMVAGMTVSHNGLWVTPAIRGIGSRVGENSVAQYVDGVYIANPVTALSEFAAVERIEILKGPQGTLFGRNATGGAINIITPDPGQTLEVRGSAFLEERDGWGVTGYLNIPLTDTLAVNMSGNYRESDGWITEASNPVAGGAQPLPAGTKINALSHSDERIKLKFTPSSSFDATIAYWHGALSDPGAGVYPAISNQLLGYVGPAPVNQVFAGSVPINKAKFDQASLKLNGHFGDWSVSSLTAYRDDRNKIIVDVSQSLNGPILATWDSSQKTTSQEFIVTGELGRLEPVVGLFLYNDKFSKIYVGADHRQKTSSIAPFVDLTFHVSDKLTLIGGLRYTYEKRKFGYFSLNNVVNFETSKSFENFSPRAVIKYDLDSRSNVYASFSQGFKSGLYNTDATGLTSVTNLAAQPLEAEKLTAYEIGYKRGDSLLNVALAGFYYDWKNIQTNRYVNGNTIAQNAAAAEIYGVEAQLTVNPINNFSIFFNGSLMHARYTKFPDGSASVQGTAGNFFDVNNVTGPLGVAVSQDWTGERLLNAPDVSFNVGFNWNVEGIGPGALSINPNVRYSSEYAPNGILLTNEGRNLLDRKAVTFVDLNVAYKIKQFTLSVYGRNLFNEKFYAEPNYNGLGVYGLWSEPQTIGAKIAFEF